MVKQRGVDAEAESDGRYDGEGECGGPAESAKSVADVLAHRLDGSIPL
jgi:hypothetical protein